MTKGRKTTQEERAKIVAFCIEHNYDYGLTVETYGVSYNQIYAWVRKYEEGGVDKLKDNRGRTKPMEEYTRKVPASTKPNYTPALGRIYEYVEKHFKEDITINDVAQELGYSPKYISHTLALIPDSNFRKILNSRRIFNAKWWLLNSEKTVLEIALQAGYAQERTFYRAFKQETGITPCEFRKKYK